ncbi:MAG: PD-(D/E)XK nuclease family protein [Armatimonadota bacterium]|nr:PD-(D/E)XK nuclease family protein [Armatimonadota bacterium]
MEEDPIELSVSSLADLAECACDRCYWLDYYMPPPVPAPVPRVVGDIDRATRDAVARWVRRYGRLPDWHPPVGEVRSVLPAHQLTAKVFRYVDRKTGVLLRGRPDMVFELADGSYHIVDYKTSRAPGRGQPAESRYRVQLNAYAFLAHQVGIKPVSGLSVVYLESGSLLSARHGGYAALAFHAQKRTVSLAADRLVPPLLRRAAQILRNPGSREPHPECDTCQQLVRWARELVRAAGR